MQLGAFSVSLAVKDIVASEAFYARLGFKPVGGNGAQGWLILRNESTTIGLFQGMFDRNTLTFNPGWDAECNTLSEFTDVRELEKALDGLEFTQHVEPGTSGPGWCALVDPDGNPVLIDQHV